MFHSQFSQTLRQSSATCRQYLLTVLTVELSKFIDSVWEYAFLFESIENIVLITVQVIVVLLYLPSKMYTQMVR